MTARNIVIVSLISSIVAVILTIILLSNINKEPKTQNIIVKGDTLFIKTDKYIRIK